MNDPRRFPVPTEDTLPTGWPDLPQWVVMRLTASTKPGKPGKLDKVPFIPRSERHAKINDATTWRSHAEAMADLAGRRPAGRVVGHGLAFAISRAMLLTLLDLDRCILPDGSLTPEAADFVAAVDSFTERSISGTGLHVIVSGHPPPDHVAPPPRVEVYPGRRFVTLTGRILDGRDVIHNRADLLADLCPAKPPLPPLPVSTSALADDEIIRLARAARNGEKFARLFDAGDTSAYDGDQSRADEALCSIIAFWTQNPEQVLRIVARSALWDRKWQREDYQRSTLAVALHRDEVYTPRPIVSHPIGESRLRARPARLRTRRATHAS